MIPQLEPGDLVIVDNATFHKGESIREIVEDAGCEIWYLPAYSPDLNKIENWWSVLKTWMKQMLPEFETVRECVDAAFKNCQTRFCVVLYYKNVLTKMRSAISSIIDIWWSWVDQCLTQKDCQMSVVHWVKEQLLT